MHIPISISIFIFMFIVSGMEVLTPAVLSHVEEWILGLLETTDTVTVTRREFVDFLRTETQQLGEGHGRFSR